MFEPVGHVNQQQKLAGPGAAERVLEWSGIRIKRKQLNERPTPAYTSTIERDR